MSDSIKAYMDKLEDKISTGHFQSNAKELEKVMSNKETINSKKLTVKVFEKEYPELSKEFQKIQKEMYELFAQKHMDYGLNNIALGGDILNSKEDKKFSLTGLAIRLTDKISRLKNLLINGKNFVEGEGMEDTFIDIANYGIIGLLVGRNKWKK
jgi:hypothetical protein